MRSTRPQYEAVAVERGLRCVLCGEAAGMALAYPDGRSLPVCDGHVMAADDLETLLAIAAFRAAVLTEFASLLTPLADWLVALAGRLMRSNR